jgi:hypothetical protein
MTPEPWDKLPEESEKQFLAFQFFLQLGPERTQAAMAEAGLACRNTITEWYRRFSWADRSAAYDASNLTIQESALERDLRDLVALQVRAYLKLARENPGKPVVPASMLEKLIAAQARLEAKPSAASEAQPSRQLVRHEIVHVNYDVDKNGRAVAPQTDP